MEISRIGAAANHGSRSVSVDDLVFTWQRVAEKMQAKSKFPVRDFATDSKHIYTIRLDIDEVSAMISALARDFAKLDDEKIRSSLRPLVPDLIKIANLASNA